MIKKLALAMCCLLIPCLLAGCGDLNHCYPSKYKDSDTYVRRGYTDPVELTSKVRIAFTAKKKQTINVEFEISYGHDKNLANTNESKEYLAYMEKESITFAVCRQVTVAGSRTSTDVGSKHYIQVDDDFMTDDYAITLAGSRNKCGGRYMSWRDFPTSFTDTFDVYESELSEGKIYYYLCLMKDGEEYDDTMLDDGSINDNSMYQYYIAWDGSDYSVNFEISDGEVTLS